MFLADYLSFTDYAAVCAGKGQRGTALTATNARFAAKSSVMGEMLFALTTGGTAQSPAQYVAELASPTANL